MLNWWLYSGLKFKHSYWGINGACMNNCIDALKWIEKVRIKNNIDLDYSNDLVLWCKFNPYVLYWLKNNIKKLNIEDKSIIIAIENRIKLKDKKLTNWLIGDGIKYYDLYSMDNASENGRLDVLDLWKDSNLELNYTEWSNK